MKPVDQTKFGAKDGNCFSAAVASILEIPLEDVPWFMETPGMWWKAFSAWCSERGYKATYWPSKAWSDENPDGGFAFSGIPAGYSIMSGGSPRFPGGLHSVVALGAEIVHDPHPSRLGVTGGVDLHDFVTIERAGPS